MARGYRAGSLGLTAWLGSAAEPGPGSNGVGPAGSQGVTCLTGASFFY